MLRVRFFCKREFLGPVVLGGVKMVSFFLFLDIFESFFNPFFDTYLFLLYFANFLSVLPN